MGEISLNIAVFQDHRALMKLNIVAIHCWTSQMSTFGTIFALKTFEKKNKSLLQIQWTHATYFISLFFSPEFIMILFSLVVAAYVWHIRDRQTHTYTHAQSTVCYVFSLLNGFIQYIHTYQSLTYPLYLFLYLYLTFSQSVVSIWDLHILIYVFLFHLFYLFNYCMAVPYWNI